MIGHFHSIPVKTWFPSGIQNTSVTGTDWKRILEHNGRLQNFPKKTPLTQCTTTSSNSKRHIPGEQQDKLLCAYIKMNLLSKEIAPLLNISLRGWKSALSPSEKSWAGREPGGSSCRGSISGETGFEILPDPLREVDAITLCVQSPLK